MARYGIRENPYVGLRPFGLDDSLYFFGRRQQVGELLELLHRTHFLAVVGSSGCGKSSLIRAGLIPALRGGFLVEDRARWLEAVARPGDAPLMNLAEALVARDAAGPDAAERLRQDLAERHTEAALDAIVPRLGADANLLLLVDQFEELFAFRGFEEEEHLDAMSPAHRRRIRSRRAEAADFVDLLLALAARTDLPVYVVLTMRTDFLGDCDLFYGLPEAMNRSRYLVPRLDREQLRAAIEGPARLGGGSVAPRLVDTLLNELGDRADRLPILQHALQRTWQAAHRNGADSTLDLEAYRTAGTLEDALSDDAEEAVQHTDLDVAARVFKRLTDTDLAGRRVRRPARFSELVAVSGADAETVRALLDAFHGHDRSFVYFSEHDPATGDFRVDLSHESLIRQWDRLKDWVDEEHRDRAVYRELVDRARADREPLRGRDLRRAWTWQRRFRPTPAWAARYDTQQGDFGAAAAYLRRSRRRRHYRRLG
ncbi:MAG: hypothetical protein R3247_09405, partial [Rhodothermales bacterium]|nr:hypothetical protein [Rhodothermales bacterium]